MKNIFLTLLLVGLANAFALGQERCTFKVIDSSENLPLPLVNVCILSANGAKSYFTTNDEGIVNVPYQKGMSCSFSYMGFKKQLFPIEKAGKSTIKMKPDLLMLDQVVKTASVEPETIDKSIYRVGVINGQNLEKRGIQNVQEALRFQPNINLQQDGVLGSKMVMQGLSGKYVKILIDGMPVVGRQDGDIDLSQLDASQIDHIEVIEGPLSVVYGSNALAGTINIITKENVYYPFSGQVKAYAESVGMLSGNLSFSGAKGKHRWSANGGYRYFDGVDLDESNRSMSWNPKQQENAEVYYGYKNNGWNTKIGTRFSREHLDVLGNYVSPSALKTRDNNFTTDRITYYGNVSKRWMNQSSLQGMLSYNTYARGKEVVFINRNLGIEELEDETVETFNTWNGRLSYAIPLSSWFKLQTGYELVHEVSEGNKLFENNGLMENAWWTETTIKLSESFELQPGLRLLHHNAYEAPLIYSSHLKWNNENLWTGRLSFAKGFQTPSLKELYMNFVDSNHEIYGNPDLSAETSYNLTGSIGKSIQQNDASVWKLDGTFFYNHINHVIEMIQSGEKAFIYENIEQKRTQGGTASVAYNYNNRLKVNASFTLTGTGYNLFDDADFTFRYAKDVVTSLNYFVPSIDLSAQVNYKYTGERVNLIVNKEGEIMEGSIEDYSMLNLSMTKSFKNKKYKVTAGANNLLDVAILSNSSSTGGAHSGGNSVVAWGRSFFVSVSYNLNKI